MPKVNWTPIIVGVGIAGVAGLILWYTLKKKEEPISLGVFYVSDLDLSSAQLVKSAKPEAILIRGANIGEGGTVAQALADISGYDLTVSIGGSITNPLYVDALGKGLVKALLAPGDKEAKRVTLNGKDIIFAAGYDAVDTVVAVNDAIALI